MPVDDPIAEARRQWLEHGWDSAADGMTLVTSLTRVHQLVSEQIDLLLRPYDLTFARFEILRILAFTKHGALPMSKLGSRLQVRAASITSAVNRLQQQGYVERRANQDDRRIVLATITGRGRRVIESATSTINRDVFAQPGLSPRDVAALVKLLREFRAAAGDIPPAR